MDRLRTGYNTPGTWGGKERTPGEGTPGVLGGCGAGGIAPPTATATCTRSRESLDPQQAARPKNNQPSVGVSNFFGVARMMSSTAEAETVSTVTVARSPVSASG